MHKRGDDGAAAKPGTVAPPEHSVWRCRKAWFLPLALPLTLLAGTILALTLALARMLDLSPFPTIATAMSAAAVLAVGLELLLNRYLADRWFVSWSAVAFACTLPLVLLLFYLRKRFKPMQAEIRKRLHL